MNWKYSLSTIVAITSIAVPVWLWRADLNSHSMRVHVISRTALQPYTSSAISGLRVSIDGHEIDDPYLTVVDILNDGARPIAATDFESPMEIRVAEGVKIVRHYLTAKHPKDIEPTISEASGALRIEPLLMNPNDSLTVALVTSGGMPVFSARARISGIPSVVLEDRSTTPPPTAYTWYQVIAAFALLTTYMLAARAAIATNRAVVRRRALLFIGLSAALGSALISVRLQRIYEISLTNTWPVVVFIVFAAIGLSTYLNRGASPSE